MWDLIARIFKEKTKKEISIYEHILIHINPYDPGLLPGGEELPDESDYFGDLDIRWVPGAMDAAHNLPQTLDAGEAKKRMNEIMEAFKGINQKSNAQSIEQLENALCPPDTITIIDKVLQSLITKSDFNQPMIYQICRNLLSTSQKRGVVKFCIGVMGLFAIPDDIEIFKNLARHEEFTLYSIVAVVLASANPTDHWLEMARNVDGWGRIHLIYRLAEINRKDVKNFLLHEGCRNKISGVYTAFTIAESVGLDKILSKKSIKQKDFEGAGVLIKSLAEATRMKNTFKGLESMDNSARFVKDYLKHADKLAKSFHDYLAIDSIIEIINYPEIENNLEWSRADLEEIKETALNILKRPKFRNLVKNAVNADKPDDIVNAAEVADRLGIDITDEMFNQLKSKPTNIHLWLQLLKRADGLMVEKLTSFAVEILNLEKKKRSARSNISAGFSSSLSIIDFSCSMLIIEIILHTLINFPGRGWDVIKIYLESPVVRDKNVAIKILNCWEKEMINDEIINRLINIIEDPDEDEMVKIGAKNLCS